MTYFPPLSTTPAAPAKCPGCDEWYVPTPGMENLSCCVAHGPGSCCHFGETRVEPPMAFCPACERCVEAENMEDVLILGSDGETERMCWDCADQKRGR